jgi:general secretion pathway protein G
MTNNGQGTGMPSGRSGSQAGFTLIELLIVMAILGILVTIAQPSFQKTVIKAREAVLKDDLFQLREAIDQYYVDNGKYPDQLDDLVSTEDQFKSYLRAIPKDPFTNAADWITVAPSDNSEGGVFDVHSASSLLALDGTSYNTW